MEDRDRNIRLDKIDYKIELCLKEIDIVQSNIQRFDQNGLKIKSWCLTLWTALAALGIQSQNIFIILTSSITTSAFCYTELIYRRFQIRFIDRSREIEEILRSGKMDLYEYSVNRAATQSDLKRELKFVLNFPQFANFYASLLLITLMLAALMLFYPKAFSGFDASVF